MESQKSWGKENCALNGKKQLVCFQILGLDHYQTEKQKNILLEAKV